MVDDDADTREALTLALRGEGFRVLSAGDGYQALTLARSRAPDIVITDLRMPEMDGEELCRRLKSHPDTLSIPIIVCSADHGVSRELLALIERFLPKPVAVPALLQAVREVAG